MKTMQPNLCNQQLHQEKLIFSKQVAAGDIYSNEDLTKLLKATSEQLRATSEQLSASNDQLSATRDQLRATNDQQRVTIEKMEAMKSGIHDCTLY